MMKYMITGLALLMVLTGCNSRTAGTSEIRVLAAQGQPASDRTYIENTAQATYQDKDGRPPQEPVVSNKVVVPFGTEEECQPPERPEPPLVTYVTEVTPKRTYAVVASKHLAEPVYVTETKIPKRPPHIVLRKYPDRDVLCCEQGLVFYIQFKNTGGEDAFNVEIVDEIPAGVDYVEDSAGSMPYLTDIIEERGPNGKVAKLTWKILGPVPPGGEGKVYYTVDCEKRRPKLDCTVVFEPLVIGVGDSTNVTVKIRNSGDGVAPKCKMQFEVPAGVEYEGNDKGQMVNIDVGDVPPGQTVDQQFTLKMVKPVDIKFLVRVTDANGNQTVCATPIPPKLTLTKNGPARTTHKRPVTYTITTKNVSGVVATDCVITDELPKNCEFQKASEGGTYQEDSHSVIWRLGDLPPDESRTVSITIVATSPGEANRLYDKARVTCAEGIIVSDDAVTVVEGVPAMHIMMYDTEDPVELNETTTYVIEVRNEGFKLTTNVKLVDTLDQGMQFVSAEGRSPSDEPIRMEFRGGQVVFDPIPVMKPGDKAVYKITIKTTVLQDYLNKAILTFSEFDKPIIVEEPTKSFK